jgi:hypothetical protein
MAGTDTLPASQTNSLVSPQACHLRAHRGKLFDELFALRLIPELLAATVWARTEFDLNILINLFRLMPEGARMSTLASRPFGRHGAFLWLEAERSSLAVGGTLGGFERLFQLGEAFGLSFQLLLQVSVLGPQGLQFGRHLAQTLSLPERGLE